MMGLMHWFVLQKNNPVPKFTTNSISTSVYMYDTRTAGILLCRWYTQYLSLHWCVRRFYRISPTDYTIKPKVITQPSFKRCWCLHFARRTNERTKASVLFAIPPSLQSSFCCLLSSWYSRERERPMAPLRLTLRRAHLRYVKETVILINQTKIWSTFHRGNHGGIYFLQRPYCKK